MAENNLQKVKSSLKNKVEGFSNDLKIDSLRGNQS